jgi:hypothetical protein
MASLLIVISKLLACDVHTLHDVLNHPSAVKKVSDFLKDKRIRTTYYGRTVTTKEIKFGGLSLKNSSEQTAYEGFLNM